MVKEDDTKRDIKQQGEEKAQDKAVAESVTKTANSADKADQKKDSPGPDSGALDSKATNSKASESKTAGPEAEPKKADSSANPAPVQDSSGTTSEEKPSTKGGDKPTADKSKAKSGGGFFKVLLMLVLLAGLALAAYWFYTQRDQNGEAAQLLESQQQSVAALEKELREERTARQQQATALEQITNELQLRVNSQSNRLRELSTTTRSDWLLAEAEYLMRLANQRLVTERNTKNPVALLVTADQILRDLDDVDLFPVRKALADDITALKVAVNVDREGLFLQLDALTGQIVKLPLLQKNPAGEPEPLSEVAASEEEQSWQEKISDSFNVALERLFQLVRVRQRENPVEPLLSPDEELFVRHNLRILLEQAQLSLLREEQAVYETSLKKAHNWLNQYFEFNDNSSVLADQLQQLSEQQVVQGLPDISASLESLRTYIDSWHKRQEVAKPASQDEGDA